MSAASGVTFSREEVERIARESVSRALSLAYRRVPPEFEVHFEQELDAIMARELNVKELERSNAALARLDAPGLLIYEDGSTREIPPDLPDESGGVP